MSDWIRPKFAYNPGSGNVDFSPLNPATKKVPAGDGPLSAVRHDDFTSTGERQSVVERIDELIELPFESVPQSELSDWKSFMSFALTGAQFDYYPDASDQLTFYPVSLEDMEYKPKYVAFKTFSITITLRIWVGTATYFS